MEIVSKITKKIQKTNEGSGLELINNSLDWLCGLSMSKQKFLQLAQLFWKNFTPDCEQLLEYYLSRYNEEEKLDLNNVIIYEEVQIQDLHPKSPLQKKHFRQWQTNETENAIESLRTVGQITRERSNKL